MNYNYNELETTAIQESCEPEALEEIFGLGKKNRYIIGILDSESNPFDNDKLARAIMNILKENRVEDIQKSTGNARHFFTQATAYTFEYTCSEKIRDKIRLYLEGIQASRMVALGNNLSGAEAKEALKRVILVGTVRTNVRESLDEVADSWYTQEW
jgi:hypothetical protein